MEIPRQWELENLVETQPGSPVGDKHIHCPVPDVNWWKNEFTYGRNHAYRICLIVNNMYTRPNVYRIECEHCYKEKVSCKIINFFYNNVF